MRHLSLFIIVFLFISFFTLTASKAFALQAEAVFGEPFGVCRIELPLSTTEQELVTLHGRSHSHALFEIIHQALVYESNKRALYPVWNTYTGETDVFGNKTLLFLFQGRDELDILLSRTGFEAYREKVRIKPIENVMLHKVLIEEWWDAYITKLKNIQSLDFYEPTVELGIASMMGRRLGLPLNTFRSRYKGYYSEFDNVFSFLLGTESIRLAMQTDTMLETKDKSEEADIDLPAAVLPPAMPIPPFDEGKVKVEHMAMRVPSECFYLRFGSFSAFLKARDFLDSRGTILRSTVSSRSVDYGMSKRIERQLALRETILSRNFGSSVISDVAIIGTDTFLREGAAIGILFQAKQNALLKKQLDSIRNDILKEDPSVRESLETINGRKVSLLSSPGNEVRSFYVQDGDFHLVTTSKWIAQRFLATGEATSLSLGSLSEFRYARSQIDSTEKGVFIYLSDPFFSNLVSPAYRVEMTRRTQSISEIQMLSLARLAAAQEGHAVTSVASLIENGYLPKGFDMRHDKSELILENDSSATDSVRGSVGSFLPIPDMTIDKITSAEAEAYKVFARAYSGIWTNMDPVFGLLCHESNSTGERLELKLNISPYARSRYGDYIELLGNPTRDRIAIVSGDLISLELRLSIPLSGFPPNLHFFGRLRDMEIPWNIRHGATPHYKSLLHHADRFTGFYFGVTVPSGDFERQIYNLLGIRGKLDANGYTKLGDISNPDSLDKLWLRRFGSFIIVSTGLPILETVSSNIRVVKADNPSQISLSIGDLSQSQVGVSLRTDAYARDRRTSAGNALLLQVYQQQLQPLDLNDAIKAVQNQSLTCPLGGAFSPADEEQQGRWESTAWTEGTLYHTNELPDTYRQAIVDEIESIQLEFSIDPDTLKTRLEIQTK